MQELKRQSGTWTYLVEMAQGVEPNFGRVGAETMVVFDEIDLWALDPNAEPAIIEDLPTLAMQCSRTLIKS